jgi:hypothetical protein
MNDFSYLQTTDCKPQTATYRLQPTDWKSLGAIVVVESTTLRQGKEQKDRRFFLTS